MSIAESSPFAMADKLFPDSYFGQTDPVEHHLPVYSEGEGPSFKDFIDTINPLQHIPVVATIYREITGDRPGAVARLAGGALYGGPVGLFTEVIDCAIDDNTGKDIGDTMLAMVKDGLPGSPANSDGQTAIATAAPPPPPPPDKPVASALAAAIVLPPEPPAPAAAPQSPVTAAPVAAAQPPAAQPVAPPVQAAAAAPATAAAAPMALAQDTATRYRPLPARRTGEPAPLPARIPVSTNGQRSNVPITGYNPNSAANAATMQRVMAEQSQQPMAPGLPPAGAGQDWFSSSMMQALNKYQRAGGVVQSSQTASPQP